MSRECKLTTFDNPFDPFVDFRSWFNYDVEKGYNSCNHLMRIARISDEMSEKEKDDEIERAIDEIIKLDFQNVFKKLVREY